MTSHRSEVSQNLPPGLPTSFLLPFHLADQSHLKLNSIHCVGALRLNAMRFKEKKRKKTKGGKKDLITASHQGQKVT